MMVNLCFDKFFQILLISFFRVSDQAWSVQLLNVRDDIKDTLLIESQPYVMNIMNSGESLNISRIAHLLIILNNTRRRQVISSSKNIKSIIDS